MPKKGIVEQHYLTAFQILISGEWFAVNPCDCYDANEFPLYSNTPNPEQLLLRQEAYDELSAEAKEIIYAIVNCPEEMLYLFKTRHKKMFSKKVTRKYFRKKWRSKFIVDLAFKEITEWVNQL